MPAILYCYSNMGRHYIHEYLTRNMGRHYIHEYLTRNMGRHYIHEYNVYPYLNNNKVVKYS
jgi:hypothetical protein